MMVRLPVLGFAALVFTLTFTGCTTNTTALDMRLPPVEAHVIGSNVVSRKIASQEDAFVFESAFLQILNSTSAAASTKTQLDRSPRLFFRAQSLVSDFDSRLDEMAKSDPLANPSANPTGNLLTDDSYAKVLSAQVMHDQLHATIRYIYARSIELQAHEESGFVDPGLTSSAMTNVRQIDSAFRSLIATNEASADRLAKQNLFEDMIAVHDEFREFANSHENAPKKTLKRVEAFDKLVKSQLMQDPRTLEVFYKKNENTIARRARVTRTDTELNSQIDAMAVDYKKQWVDLFDSRSPQSAGLKPQVGPSGMMNGTNYRQGRWSITFDDGPSSKYTPMALANLKQAGLKTTFFWLAQNTPRVPSAVSAAKAAGHGLACHSYSHPQLPKLGAASLRHEIVDASQDETKDYGQKIEFFRCPYGACGTQTSAIRQMIADNGMIRVTWNVDSLDWQDKNPASVYARVKKQMASMKRGIILFHDIHPQSIAASKMLMADFARDKTLRELSVGEAKEELNSPGGMQ